MTSLAHHLDTSLFQAPLQVHETLSDFYKNFRAVNSAHSIALNRTRLDLEFHDAPSDTLCFFLAGSQDREKVVRLPAFNGRSTAKDAPFKTIFISDPSLYLSPDLGLAWYAGNQWDALQAWLGELLLFIADTVGAKRVLFFGGSGAGFANLFYARHFPASLSVIWNPQTNLERYHKRNTDAYALSAFDVNAKALGAHIVTDLCAVYAKNSYTHKIICFQNADDTHHVQQHLAPFLAAQNITMPKEHVIEWVSPNILLFFKLWGQGHTPPPRAALKSFLRVIGNDSCEWTQEKLLSALVDKALRFTAP